MREGKLYKNQRKRTERKRGNHLKETKIKSRKARKDGGRGRKGEKMK